MSNFPASWFNKNERLNANHILTVGDRVIGPWGESGTVVRIDGEVSQDSQEDRGNIELNLDSGETANYTLFHWQRNFRRIYS